MSMTLEYDVHSIVYGWLSDDFVVVSEPVCVCVCYCLCETHSDAAAAAAAVGGAVEQGQGCTFLSDSWARDQQSSRER